MEGHGYGYSRGLGSPRLRLDTPGVARATCAAPCGVEAGGRATETADVFFGCF